MAVREQQIGFVLLALGALLLLTNLSGADTGWLWVGAIAAAFLYGYARRREPGLAVPGGILAGVAAGILLESLPGLDGIFLLGLAGGFYLVATLEPTVHRWALWPAAILGVIAALTVVSTNQWLFIAALVLGGLYFLSRTAQRGTTRAGAPARVDDATGRYNRLAAWRGRRAADAGVLPTDFMGNDQLERIANENPRDLEKLGRMVEPAQLERYGQEILDTLRA